MHVLDLEQLARDMESVAKGATSFDQAIKTLHGALAAGASTRTVITQGGLSAEIMGVVGPQLMQAARAHRAMQRNVALALQQWCYGGGATSGLAAAMRRFLDDDAAPARPGRAQMGLEILLELLTLNGDSAVDLAVCDVLLFLAEQPTAQTAICSSDALLAALQTLGERDDEDVRRGANAVLLKLFNDMVGGSLDDLSFEGDAAGDVEVQDIGDEDAVEGDADDDGEADSEDPSADSASAAEGASKRDADSRPAASAADPNVML